MVRSTVIIPAYDNAALTRQCLDAVLRLDACRVVVVDDASSDETVAMLRGYGNRIQLLTHRRNLGFARTCNDGAGVARTEFVVFLNNDTIPRPGWLKALERHARAHPAAAVVGSRLLYPTGTVQHAGVVICQDRYPRHVYAGFPADHPAVNRSRRYQIVTAASMLVRRRVFEEAGGFDTAFRNGFEDVDLCLRLGAAGHEVHYCAESVVEHLESVAPGRFKRDGENVALYRRRWLGRVQPDDLRYYVEDGLLRLSYEGSFPIQFDLAPELATLDGGGRGRELERLLQEKSRQVADLTREVARLTLALQGRQGQSAGLAYNELRERIRETIQLSIPAGATVLVVSKGDTRLLELPGREGWHFPRTERGAYAGHHPADGKEAIAHLEALRVKGATHLVFPSTAFWWLEHYADFRRHLEDRFGFVMRPGADCNIVELKAANLFAALRPPATGSGRIRSRSGGATRPGGGRRKVLYVCHNHPVLSPGGAEIYAWELYDAMRASCEFEPILLARSGSVVMQGRAIAPGSPLATLPGDDHQFLLFTRTQDFDSFGLTSRDKGGLARHFGAFLEEHRPEVIHFQHTLFLGHDLIRQARESLPEAGIVHTLHEYLPICHRNGQMVRVADGERCLEASPRRCHQCFPEHSEAEFRRRKRSILSSFSHVDLFIAPSRFLLERYVDWGIPRRRIRLEEYGRQPFAAPVPLQSSRARNRIGYFGQLNHFKGVDVLLKAMEIVAASEASGTGGRPGSRDGAGPEGEESAGPAHLWLHGANLELQPFDFQGQFRELMARVRSSVTFVGRYQRESLGALMANVDWVVVPSVWWENSPLVIQEAFAFKRPVICSDAGGMAEKVQDGVNGLHFRAGDPASLAEVIRRAATTAGLWETLSRGCPPVHSMTRHVEILSGIYRRLVSLREDPGVTAAGHELDEMLQDVNTD